MILLILGILFWPFVGGMFSAQHWKYAVAREYQAQGEEDKARTLLRELVEQYPAHAAAWYRLAEISFATGNYEKALTEIERAEAQSRGQQKYYFQSFKSNVLFALERNQEAYETMVSLRPMTDLGEDPVKLDREELTALASKRQARQYLNGVAYISGLSGVQLDVGEKCIEAVVGIFEKDQWRMGVCAPYLFERASRYQKALDGYQRALDAIRKEIDGYQRKIDRYRELESRRQDSDENDSKKSVLNRRLQYYEKLLRADEQYQLLNRIRLLSEKLEQPQRADQARTEMDWFRSADESPEAVGLEIDDQTYYAIAFELQHYLDTRGVVRLKLGDYAVAEMVDNQAAYDRLKQKATDYYNSAYSDIQKALELGDAIEAYDSKFPENSANIELPSDKNERQREELRNRAVELNHLARALRSMGEPDRAEEVEQQIEELGFSPGRLLF